MYSGCTPGTLKPMTLMILRVLVSMTEAVPATSDVTHSLVPSAVNSAKRGRDPTRTLSVISELSVSMKWAMLVVSEVTTTVLPSGLTPTPSGSTPTSTSARSEEHTSELQSLRHLVCRLLLEK